MDPTKNKFNLNAIIGIIFSVFSILLLIVFLYARNSYNAQYATLHHASVVVSAFLGFIIGILALKKIRRTNEGGKNMAEIAITIGIVFLLVYGLVVFSFRNVRDAGSGMREARRVSDVKQIQIALDLFYKDAGYYPDKINFGGTLEYNNTIYMNIVPQNRLPNDGYCPEDSQYRYFGTKNGQSYKLEYCLGMDVGGISSGYHVATPNKIADP
jgi:hypothetical protein